MFITPPMASEPFSTLPGPRLISRLAIDSGSKLITLWTLPARKMALFMRMPSTVSSTREVLIPRIIGEPPPL